MATAIDDHSTDPSAWPADIVTAVVSVPATIGRRVVEALASIRVAHPGHHFYPVESLHLTLESLRGLSETSVASGAAISPLRQRILGVPAPTMWLGGVGLVESSAFLRVRLSGDDPARPVVDPGRRLPPHVNIVRFIGDAGPRLRSSLAHLRLDDVGSFVPTEVVVVRCNKVMATSSLTVLERIPFAQAQRHGAP